MYVTLGTQLTSHQVGALCGGVVYDLISLNPSKILNSQIKRKNSDLL